jgi:serine/threonine-protein phosphatase 2A regulatory subunit A
LNELLKDDNSEVKLNVIDGVIKVSKVIGSDFLQQPILQSLIELTKDLNWRVRMSSFERLADLGSTFGSEMFVKNLQTPFFTYLQNTAASVRNMGVEKSGELAEKYGSDWIISQFIPVVQTAYNLDKKGYNYRMCCLKSFSVIMPFVQKDVITKEIIPIFLKACKDEVPNVKFCVAKIIA